MGNRYKGKVPPRSPRTNLLAEARKGMPPREKTIPGIYSLIDTKIALGWDSSPEELKEHLEPLPLTTAFAIFGSVGAMLHNNRNTSRRETQLGFLREFETRLPYNRRIVQELQRFPSSILVHEEQMAALHKFAVLHCKGETLPNNLSEHVVKAMLAYNYLLGEENAPSAVATPDDFVKLELRSLFHQNEGVLGLIHRHTSFIEWTKTPDAAKRDSFLPVSVDFERLIGMTYDEYVTSCFAVLAHFMTIRSAREASRSIINLSAFTSGMKYSDTLVRWVMDNSITLDDFRIAVLAGGSEYAGVHLLPLLKRPLVLLDRNTIVCPYLGFLENLLGAGLFFKLDHAYKSEGRGEQFARLFSHFFEGYAVSIVDRVAKKSGLHYEVEKRFGSVGQSKSDKSTDLVLFEKPNAVWIEVVATRVNYVRTLANFEEDSVNRDFRNIILKKAEQIDKNIKAFRRGLLRYDGIDAADFTNCFPVVLVIHPIPHFVGITALISKAIEEGGLLRDCVQLQIIDIETLESLEVAMAKGLLLSALLTEKLREPGKAAMTMRNYKHYFRRDLGERYSEHVLSMWQDTWNGMVRALRSWGFEMSGDLPPHGSVTEAEADR